MGALTSVEIAFSRIFSLELAHKVHNLLSLSLICTSTKSLSGLEAVGHSLETLDCTGCDLKTMETTFLKLTALRNINLGENQIKKIDNLKK